MSTYRKLLNDPSLCNVHLIIARLANVNLELPTVESMLDLEFSKRLNLASTSCTTAERFKFALNTLGLSVNEFASLYGLDRGFVKRVSFLSKPNPSTKSLTPWLKNRTSASVLVFVFFPKVHNRFQFSI